MPLIVIVDDAITNRAIYTRLATNVEPGVVVQPFGRPHEALTWLAENAADLIITDYKMPDMHGAEFTRRLRMLPVGADAPVIVITAYADREFRIEALEAGATDFLRSPVDHYEFQTRVRNLLKLSRQQRIIRDRAVALERELKESEISRDRLLRDSSERLAQVIDTIPAMISATDATGRCIFVNAYQTQLLGSDASQGADTLECDAGDTPANERGWLLDRSVLSSRKALPSFEEEVTDRSGEPHTFMTTKSPLRDASGCVVGVLTTSLDITERKRAEARLVYEAHHDHLTALPNRALLHERLRQELARSATDGSQLALHFVDLDRFKYVNDGLGHHFGDRLLQAVAERLRGAVRGQDVVARLGGDEFAILQTEVRSAADAAAFAERINRLVVEPFTVEGREVTISASIGVTMHPRDGHSPEELLRNADLAMYRVKTNGRNDYAFFTDEMLSHAREAIVVETALRQALDRRAFKLFYQPQISLVTGEVIGAEALLRWPRSGEECLDPGDFLRVAEDSGLMRAIDEWVLQEACIQARQWMESARAPVRVSVNLSPLQFRGQDLSAIIMQVLKETGLPPTLLDLELTEGILLQHAQAASKDLEELHRRGVRLSVDDFGTGYSSLARLSSLHVDRLKIDRSFVTNLAGDPNNMAIVRAVVSLGRALNIEVLAEGVETERQMEQLRAAGCDAVQGFHTGRPMEAGRFATFLDERQSGSSRDVMRSLSD